jgi:hypothetical protein
MPRVLQCTDWNETTQTCVTESWVLVDASVVSYLPTVEQAQTVGGAMFAACCVLAAMSLLLPSNETQGD